MVSLRSLMIVGVLAGLTACSGPDVRFDYDVQGHYAAYKSFAFQMAPGPTPARPGGLDNPIMNARVRRVVEAGLAAKGFQPAGAGEPDFLVSFFTISERERTHQARLGVGFGMGPIGVGVAGPVGDRRVETVGSLVLEILDARSNQVVWKATAVRALEGSDSPEEADAAVKGAVDAMLKRFPPTAK